MGFLFEKKIVSLILEAANTKTIHFTAIGDVDTGINVTHTQVVCVSQTALGGTPHISNVSKKFEFKTSASITRKQGRQLVAVRLE